MNRMLIAIAGLVAFLSGASDTWAFTTQPVTPDTMSNRLADPDQLPDKTSNDLDATAREIADLYKRRWAVR